MSVYIPNGSVQSVYFLAQGWVGGAWLDTTERFPAPSRYATAREAQDAVQFWMLEQVRNGYDSNPHGRVVKVTAEVVEP